MKQLRAVLVVAMLLVGSGLFAAASARSAQDAKTEEPPKIPGLEIPRPNGGFLGLDLVKANFVLTFYDRAKEKTAPDVARAVLRWPVRYQKLDERAVLNPAGDGKSLTSAMFIRPPHNFRLSILLFVEGSPDAVESYNVQFQK
jgi:hypothetical protein